MPYENEIDGCSTFVRSAAVCQTNEVQIEKRQQMNTITGFIDASMVYGSSQGEAEKLRVLDSKNLLHFFYCPLSISDLYFVLFIHYNFQ